MINDGSIMLPRSDVIVAKDGEAPDRAPQALFILGIDLRSGTNFLYDLLCAHEDCAPAGPIMEDYLTAALDYLQAYSTAVTAHWDPGWDLETKLPGAERVLKELLGNSIDSFLAWQFAAQAESMPDSTSTGTRPTYGVTKTPSVQGLDVIYDYLPQAKILIVVRDGRSLVESGVRSFNWNYEWAMRNWAEQAQRIIDFDRRNKDSGYQYLIVRYEDLFLETERELRRIFAMLGLDPDSYAYSRVEDMPVRGSSDVATGYDDVHWEPVQRSKDFGPLDRWKVWSPETHARFERMAGEQMRALGYDLGAPTHNWRTAAYNYFCDMRWPVRNALLDALGKNKRRRFRLFRSKS